MLNETFLVTGAMGCIGSWVLKNLVKEGVKVIAADLDTTPTRPALLMSPKELDQITWQLLIPTRPVSWSDQTALRT